MMFNERTTTNTAGYQDFTENIMYEDVLLPADTSFSGAFHQQP